jgi:hypothetical protein
MLETTTERWITYGIMWAIILGLLYIRHKVNATPQAPSKDSE